MKNRLRALSFLGALLLWSASQAAGQSKVEIELTIEHIAADGLVFKEIPIGAARLAFPGGDLSGYRVSFRSGKETFDAQLVPSPHFGQENASATLLLHAPGHQNLSGTLLLEPVEKAAASRVISGTYTVTTEAAEWTFSPETKSIFPYEVRLIGSGKLLANFSWNDRVYDASLGSFMLRNDREATLTVLSDGPIATVLRGHARYRHWQKAGNPPPGNPSATYDWYFFKGSPQVFVDAYQSADESYHWSQSVFLEWLFKEKYFSGRRSSEARESVPLTGGNKGNTSQKWSALLSDTGVVAMIVAPSMILDDLGGYGNYIRSATPSPTDGWNGRARRLTGWLWAASIGEADQLDGATDLVLSRVLETEVRVTDEATATATSSSDSPAVKGWKQALLRRKYALGHLVPDVAGVLQIPDTWRFSRSGDLGLAFEVEPDGVRLISVFDLQTQREMAADEMPPLFEIDLRSRAKNAGLFLDASQGWENVSYYDAGQRIDFRFQCRDQENARISVTVSAYATASDSAWEWKIRVENGESAWSVAEVYFPQVGLKRLHRNTHAFVPRQSGVVVAEPFHENFHFDRVYPSGSATMQFMAVYPAGSEAAGLYVARHDPAAAMKRLLLDTNNLSLSSKLSFAQIPENPETSGNGFEITGTGVWKLLRGDWFDAAKHYRNWVEKEASWWPDLTDEGRADTPRWFRELNAWITRGGGLGGGKDVENARQLMQRVRDFVGLPMGNQWYYWHQIPFDNDFPHFMPAVDGFDDAVDALQAADVHVVPYINGRLWDTRDQGTADFEFTAKARSWATKVRAGETLEVFTSSFQSRETDGSRVSLAVMCPYTEFWQDKMAEIAGRLTDELGIRGVFFDQIGASPPVPCLDPTHGHPLGGGSWWVEGYAKMLSRIQREIPSDVILTTEDNAEPYILNLDGVLTWQWILDGQVPAYPAVYGGAVQMFGRAFYAIVPGEDPNPAARMKMGQQLVFGEQVGWLSPDVFFRRFDEATQQYFKNLAHARDRIKSHIFAGEMLRAPKLEGRNPPITANWKVGGPVTVESVLTAAWKKRGENKLALIFTNVTSDLLELAYSFDPAAYGIPSTGFTVTAWKASNPSVQKKISMDGVITFSLSGLDILVWEIDW